MHNYSPELGDVVRVILYPNRFFVADATHPLKDVSMKIYNEYTRSFKSTVYPIGVIKEIFKHMILGEVWVTIYNRINNLRYSVPVSNVYEKILTPLEK